MKKNQGEFSPDVASWEPVEISYTITSDDVYNALKTSRTFRKNFIKAFIESGVLAGLVVLFGVWWIIWDDGNAMIFCIACACLIGLVWAAALFSIRSTCNRLVTGERITMRINAASITVGNGVAPSWQIPLDGSIACEEKKNSLILYTGDCEWTLLPLREMEEAKQQPVREWILQHTKRLEK